MYRLGLCAVLLCALCTPTLSWRESSEHQLAFGGRSLLQEGQAAKCGNGIQEGTEQCDSTDRKICSDKCLCVKPFTFDAKTKKCVGCGNGVVDVAKEQCDSPDRKICSATCTCVKPFTYDTKAKKCVGCGNGVVDTAKEQCDSTDRKICSATCTCVKPFTYDAKAKRCVGCGNGVVDGTEECDSTDRTVCTDKCLCASPLSFDSKTKTCVPCGDGIVNGKEECDSTDRKICTSTCKCAAPLKFDAKTGKCVGCGDGILQTGEECDSSDTAVCTSSCKCNEDEGYWYDTKTKTCKQCGDGKIDAPQEVCEGVNTLGCNWWSCKCNSDGYFVPDVKVPGNCTCKAGYTLIKDPTLVDEPTCMLCGNGKLDNKISAFPDDPFFTPEECDYTDAKSQVGCTKECRCDTAAGWEAAEDGSGCVPYCGDDIILGNEQCELGQFGCDLNTCKCFGANGFEYNSTTKVCQCKAEHVYVDDLSECTKCGNKKVDAGEACDNSIAGLTAAQIGLCDSLACTCISNSTISAVADKAKPGTCTLCGNGKLDAGEACDNPKQAMCQQCKCVRFQNKNYKPDGKGGCVLAK